MTKLPSDNALAQLCDDLGIEKIFSPGLTEQDREDDFTYLLGYLAGLLEKGEIPQAQWLGHLGTLGMTEEDYKSWVTKNHN